MSSSRSHGRRNVQEQESTKQQPPTYTSRIPTRQNVVEDGERQKPVQHVGRMMKRTSRIVPPTEPSVKSSPRTPTPVTAVSQHPSIPSRRLSSTPSSFAPPNLRTPSLVSGSSASTFDSPRPSGLRRKPSGAIDKYAAQRRAEAGTTDRERAEMRGLTGFSREDLDNTVLGITIPTTAKFGGYQASLEMAGYTYTSDPARDTTSPNPNYASSATPSTRYSDSPFSPVPTPSSASSYSPSLAAISNASRSPAKSRHVPTGAATSNNSRLSLFPVRESSTSTASSRTADRVDHKPHHQSQTATKEDASASTSNNRSTFRNRLTKAKPNVSSEKQKVQMPPELAHLNVDVASVQPDMLRPRAPARPSRHGTPTIAGMAKESSVVHSDLPPVYTTYHKRTPSQETPISASSPTKSRFGFSSRASSRTVSPRIDSAISPPPSARKFYRSQTPESSSGEGAGIRRKDSPAIPVRQSPAKSPRFGFFSRKAKADKADKPEVPKLTEKPARRQSKGPIAGTGHEGYGRYAFRARSGSNVSSTGGRSPSADSISSGVVRPAAGKRKSSTASNESELDDFLRERLRPVILRGSGSTMSSDPIGASLAPASSKSSSVDSIPRLLPSAMRKASDASAERRQSTKLAIYDSSEDDSVRRRPTLAARRSITRLSSGESKSPVRIPPPINTSLLKQQPVIDSYDAEPTAWPKTDSSLPLTEDGKEGLWLKPLDVKPSPKPARKWNFFHRAATASPVKGKQRAIEVEDLEISHNRAVAHYAMLDHMDSIGLDEVEDIVRDSTDFEEDFLSDTEANPKVFAYEGRHESAMPSPRTVDIDRDADLSARPEPLRPKTSDQQNPDEASKAPSVQPRSRKHIVNAAEIAHPTRQDSRSGLPATRAVYTPDMSGRRTPEPTNCHLGTPEQTNGSPRQPRLSPIGRIPAVVSRRDREVKLPVTSFSRPFTFAKPPGSIYSQIREMASPTEPNSQPVSSTSTRSEGTINDPSSISHTNPSISTNRTSVDVHHQSEFLTFPPRKGSDQSYSCSASSSIPSWMTTLPIQKEDVWNEYNDFMDEVMPMRTPMRTPTTGSYLGAPFQYSSMLWDGNGQSWPIPTRTPPTQQLPAIPGASTVSTILTVPQQISRFLRRSVSPITPDTISGLGSHISTFPPRQASLRNTQQTSTPHPKRSSLVSARASISSSGSSRNSTHSRSASLPYTRHSQTESSSSRTATRDTSLAGIAEVPTASTSPTLKPSTNLRIGALMTSKWLSFGRVLFSPAHNEMIFAHEPRVLIVDGLNSDWSQFVAMSYPSAQVYNITHSTTTESTSSPSIGKPPPNHRQIRLGSGISAPSFPFPKSFFNTIIFRFPTATSETTYTALLSECKRVLRPGGFLEVAIVDLDLMNMGPKTRKAVRGLKTRMQSRDAGVSLGNLSDLMVRLMGRRGFEGVMRCVVGVPVAGDVRTAAKHGRGGSYSSSGSSSEGVSPGDEMRNLSLSKLLEQSEFSRSTPMMNGGISQQQDANLTKMVARVGRWWYSSCYEKILEPKDRSIWKDAGMLRECEKQGTSLRMLICYAQKPGVTRRRTRSV